MDKRTFSDRRKQSDKDKIERFKEKVKMLKHESMGDEYELMRILDDGLKELNITEEPIGKYYAEGKIIGSGKYGMVREGYSINNPKHKVAIKAINLSNISSKYHIVAQEILTMKRIDHPNIVKMFEIYKDMNKLYLVMEFIEGKELYDFIFERNRLKESEAANIVKQLLT